MQKNKIIKVSIVFTFLVIIIVLLIDKNQLSGDSNYVFERKTTIKGRGPIMEDVDYYSQMMHQCAIRKPANCELIDVDILELGSRNYNCIFDCPKINQDEIGKFCKDDNECSGHCDISNQGTIRKDIPASLEKILYKGTVKINELEKWIKIEGHCDVYTRDEKHPEFGDIYIENGFVGIHSGW